MCIYMYLLVYQKKYIHPSIHCTTCTQSSLRGHVSEPMKSIYLYHFLLNCSFGKCNKKSVISFYWNLWITYDVFHQKECNAILVKKKLKGILFSYAHLYKKMLHFYFTEKSTLNMCYLFFVTLMYR